MDLVTVRRWVPASAGQVWDRLTDVAAFVEGQPDLDLVEMVDERLTRGGRLVLSRRHGPRLVTMEVEPIVVRRPSHLSLAITSGRARWVVSIDLEAIGPDACDLTIEACPDPSAIRGLGSLTAPATTHRAGMDLTQMLEALARHAERAARLVGTR